MMRKCRCSQNENRGCSDKSQLSFHCGTSITVLDLHGLYCNQGAALSTINQNHLADEKTPTTSHSAVRGCRRIPLRSASPGGLSSGGGRFYRDIEMDGVYNAVPLELHPNAVSTSSWKGEIELNLRRAVCYQRVRMHHVDQVVARRQHMAPGAKIFLESLAWRDAKAQLRVAARDGFRRQS